MQRYECLRCLEYQKIDHEPGVVHAYTQPVRVVMLPVYVNKVVEGEGKPSGKSMKRRWVRVGMWCPRCHSFEEGSFKPKRHAV